MSISFVVSRRSIFRPLNLGLIYHLRCFILTAIFEKIHGIILQVLRFTYKKKGGKTFSYMTINGKS